MNRIWRVEFGSYTREDVTANNAKEAINKVMSARRRLNDRYYNRVQDITEVRLLAEA